MSQSSSSGAATYASDEYIPLVPFTPPRYQLNLSLPPEQRHTQICAIFKDQLLDIVSLYDTVFAELEDVLSLRLPLRLSRIITRLLKASSRRLLTRVHSQEETGEIRGIAASTGIPIHMVVAYNTFLDLFLGCTSGGIRVDAKTAARRGRMVHFRGLDWGMAPLRRLIVQLDYVRDGQVVAGAVTYAGYVGTLTGVRAGLSTSLNFRTRLGSPSPARHHLIHKALLLYGRRPSIASRLREILLKDGDPPSLADLAKHFTDSTTLSSPCYLTFCSLESVLIIEKDLRTALVRTSDEFLVVTNHDVRMEDGVDTNQSMEQQWKDTLQQHHLNDPILDDSMERKACIVEMYERTSKTVTIHQVKEWLQTHPIQNESTHFSLLMDPVGDILWTQGFEAQNGGDGTIGMVQGLPANSSEADT